MLFAKSFRSTKVSDADDVLSWSGLEHILIERSGRQHIVLRSRTTVLQLLIVGADVTAGPVKLRFEGEGKDARRFGLQLSALARITTGRKRSPPQPPAWTEHKLKLRNALIALDGRAAGASLREIAIVIHGKAAVDSKWETGLKDRTRRDLRRGLKLSQGGYRELLRQGW